MRWQSITICVLCLLWMAALPAHLYEPRWRYELAVLPGFPLSVAMPIALAKSAAGVLPFALVYLCLRLEWKFKGKPVIFFRFAACALTVLVVFRAIVFVFFTQIPARLAV
jgi:hypothetical protein